MSTLTTIHVRVLLLLAFAILLLAAGCVRNTEDKRRNKETPAVILNPQSPVHDPYLQNAQSAVNAPLTFIGDAACAKCHDAEFKAHEVTYHASTMHLADHMSLGRLAPTTGTLPGSKARVERNGDGYQVMMPTGASGPLQYAMGSGKSAITFVSLMGSHTFEMRASYFPHQGKWKVTPGQKRTLSTALGVDHEDDEARRCIACHTTTLPIDSNIPEKRFLGVGCEACHGAGSAHVMAMQAGNSADIAMERMGRWGARRLSELCGKCHRTAAAAGILPGDAPHLDVTSRFQPYALMLSRCFKASGDSLSCITCHSPHQNTSHDQRAYETVCLTCHGQKTDEKMRKQGGRGEGEKDSHTASASVFHLPSSSSSGKRCPVNQRTGCLECHMANKPMLPGELITVSARDHFIRVRRPKQEAKWARAIKKAEEMTLQHSE